MNLAQTETALAGVRFLNGLSRRQLLALVAANVLQGAGADLTADGLKTAVGDSKFLVGAGEDAILALAVSAFITANGGVLESRSDVNAALHDARFLLGLPGAELAAVAATAYLGNPGGGGGGGGSTSGVTFESNAPLPADASDGPVFDFYNAFPEETITAITINLPVVNQLDLESTGTDHTLASIDASALVAAVGYVYLQNFAALTSADFSALQKVVGDFTLRAGGLAAFTLPALAIFGGNLDVSGAALNAESVNSLLATLVAATTDGSTPWGSGKTVNLSGGTSAAPSGQGIADAATLSGRGATVTTN